MCKICLKVHFENSGDTNRHFADRFVPDTIIPSIMARSQQKLPLLPFPPPGISPSFHHPPRVLPRESKVDRSWHNSAYTLKEATSTSIENKWTDIRVCTCARPRLCVCVLWDSTFFHLHRPIPPFLCAPSSTMRAIVDGCLLEGCHQRESLARGGDAGRVAVPVEFI